MKKLVVFVLSLFAGYAISGPVHTWTSGEYITAADLNAAISHLHASVGRGHGAVLTNADVSGSAAIGHSKLATPALLPKSWVSVDACASSPCTIIDSSGVSGVTRTSAGVYVVTYTVARSSSAYGVFGQAFHTTAATFCHTTAKTATNATVSCIDGANPHAAVDSGFGLLVMDTEN